MTAFHRRRVRGGALSGAGLLAKGGAFGSRSVGTGGGSPPAAPSLDFSQPSNSQYVAVLIL